MKSTARIFLAVWLGASSALFAASDTDFYKKGEQLYRDGRKSEAMEAFEDAMRRKQRSTEAQAFVDRIRKETVESIRNKAVTGINKGSWQTKYYYMHQIDNRVNVGVSIQELFERDSLNFRPGAIDALHDLADALGKADNRQVTIEVINEINQDVVLNKDILVQQLTAVFSYLSLAGRTQLSRF